MPLWHARNGFDLMNDRADGIHALRPDSREGRVLGRCGVLLGIASGQEPLMGKT